MCIVHRPKMLLQQQCPRGVVPTSLRPPCLITTPLIVTVAKIMHSKFRLLVFVVKTVKGKIIEFKTSNFVSNNRKILKQAVSKFGHIQYRYCNFNSYKLMLLDVVNKDVVMINFTYFYFTLKLQQINFLLIPNHTAPVKIILSW